MTQFQIHKSSSAMHGVISTSSPADTVRVLGEDHPDTLTSRNNLAGAYQAVGDLDRAIPLYEQTLAQQRLLLLSAECFESLAQKLSIVRVCLRSPLYSLP